MRHDCEEQDSNQCRNSQEATGSLLNDIFGDIQEMSEKRTMHFIRSCTRNRHEEVYIANYVKNYTMQNKLYVAETDVRVMLTNESSLVESTIAVVRKLTCQLWFRNRFETSRSCNKAFEVHQVEFADEVDDVLATIAEAAANDSAGSEIR